MPMYYGAPQLYYRNLLYTGVTRAKSLLILVGNDWTIEQMVENDKKEMREKEDTKKLTINEDSNKKI